MLKVLGYGPTQADIIIVGEAPGAEEELHGKPFVGASGHLLNELLREAGIRRSECYVTNVCKYRPPANDITKWITDKKRTGLANGWVPHAGRWHNEYVVEGVAELYEEIASHKPRIVVGLGNTPLWALTGQWGIMDWRGSEMVLPNGIMFVPTLHPAGVLRNWATRPQIAHDLRQRVTRRIVNGFDTPEWDFNIVPSLREVMAELSALGTAAPMDVAVDIETSRNQIVCVGLACSDRQALCIPFVDENGPVWTKEQYDAILRQLRVALHRSNVRIVGQNFNYDSTFIAECFGFRLGASFDTLIAQSVLFPGTPRGLGYLSSMYCDWHCYWKDDARDWNNLKDYAGLFAYNCRDVCATWEIAQQQRRMLAAAGLTRQFEERMLYDRKYIFEMQARGVNRDYGATQGLCAEIEEALQERKCLIAAEAGYPVNPTSPLQVSKWLYGERGCRKPARRGREAGGTGDEELKQVALWHPELAPVITAVLEHRSLASIKASFLMAKEDSDGKLRSSFMSVGTESLRLTSSKSAFRRGTNLLNVSGAGVSHSGNKLPNLRKCIVPDSGCTIFECDLARADLQVVAAEARDMELRAKLADPTLDMHYENAKDLFGAAQPTPVQREKGKTFVHLTNYLGSARTCAIKTGSTVHEADLAQRRWFQIHPGIKRWQDDTQRALEQTRTVWNKFGYRMVYFDRIDSCLPQALAWIASSTIAIYTSHIHMAFDDAGIEILLQCYDSVMGQYATVNEDAALATMNAAKQIAIPYDVPLVIPLGLKVSAASWGDAEKKGWPDGTPG